MSNRVPQALPVIDSVYWQPDFFRHLILFCQGGLYTDSDTVPIEPISEWPGFLSPDASVKNVISPALAKLLAVSELVHASTSETSEAEADGAAISEILATCWTQALLGYGRVWSLRLNATAYFGGNKWRVSGQLVFSAGSLGRRLHSLVSQTGGLQITQWTIAAQPHHPVLLDVMTPALKAHALWLAGDTSEPTVMNLTGPGAWSDCIFNYILVKYGIQPEQVRLGERNAVQAGDVLFY